MGPAGSSTLPSAATATDGAHATNKSDIQATETARGYVVRFSLRTRMMPPRNTAHTAPQRSSR
jgi:hypothetical protein